MLKSEEYRKVLKKYYLQDKYRLLNLLASYGIRGSVLGAFEKTPREHFLPDPQKDYAYEDRPASIGFKQTISQPSLVAMMLQSLELTHSDRVLEIGTGSGFVTALLSKLAGSVYSLERIKSLAGSAQKRLALLKIENVEVIYTDGTLGYRPKAPYDAIIVSAAFKSVPQPLVDQLADEGRLLMPVGDSPWQNLILYKKVDGKLLELRKVSTVRFVPLLGKLAWPVPLPL